MINRSDRLASSPDKVLPGKVTLTPTKTPLEKLSTVKDCLAQAVAEDVAGRQLTPQEEIEAKRVQGLLLDVVAAGKRPKAAVVTIQRADNKIH
jgi:hypothetical protein